MGDDLSMGKRLLNVSINDLKSKIRSQGTSERLDLHLLDETTPLSKTKHAAGLVGQALTSVA